jgi:hypothetical protein
MASLGDVIRSRRCGEYEIAQRVACVSYPRNGNVERPTLYYEWDLYRGGRLLDRFTTLRAAAFAARSGEYDLPDHSSIAR